MRTIDFREFMSSKEKALSLSLIPIGFWATMPPALKVAYIGYSALGLVVVAGAITSNILAKGDGRQKQWASAIDTFMKVTVMVGGVLMILWFIKTNPLLWL
jgi:uncharacterized membrane protein